MHHFNRRFRSFAVLTLLTCAVGALAISPVDLSSQPPAAELMVAPAPAGDFLLAPAADGTTIQLVTHNDSMAPDLIVAERATPARREEVRAAHDAPRLPRGTVPLSVGFLAVGMVALNKDRNTPMRDGKLLGYPVAAATRIYAGSLVVANAGYAAPGTTALNLVALGRANETVDNTAGAAGAATVQVQRGVFLFAHDGTITAADIGKTAFIVDDQTVADNNGAGTRSAAGIIRGVETGGAWIEI